MAAAIVQCATIWLLVGFVVGAVFLFVGIDRIDPSARGSYAFRPLLLPGLTLLWPFVALRWFRLSRREP
jgi:hypothetical protein